MSEAEQASVVWIRELVAGNEGVVREFVETYGPALERIAGARIPPALRRRLGADDVVQSVCRTFIRRARAGEFTLPDREHLWRLLCAITLTKVRQHIRFHLSQKRSAEREEPVSGPAEHGIPHRYQPADDAPTPAEAAEFADQLAYLVESLGEEESQIVQMKLEGYRHEEIAKRLGCAERTVGRLLKRVKQRLEGMLAE